MAAPTITLRCGDCLEVLKGMPDASVDAIVTDPPAGIGFMGKEWDDFRRARNESDAGRDNVFGRTSAKGPQYGRRVRKLDWQYPITESGLSDGGNRLIAPSIGRSSINATCQACGKRQRTWEGGPERCKCEAPKFNDRAAHLDARAAFIDFLQTIMAECFRVAKPGSRALVWAIPRTSHWTATAIENAGWVIEDRVSHFFGSGFPKHKSKLKPACEDWWMAWKPARYAVPLNIDACRIGYELGGSLASNPSLRKSVRGGNGGHIFSTESEGREMVPDIAGRWPAHIALSHHPDCQCIGTKSVNSNGHHPVARGVGGLGTAGHAGQSDLIERAPGAETVEAWECVEDCPIRMLDEQSGVTTSGAMRHEVGGYDGESNTGFIRGRSGPSNQHGGTGGASRFFYHPKASKSDREPGNKHPTVKSTALMRWLCRLITPLGGTIFDGFMGSGSTGKAAVQEGFNFIGCEREPEYFATAERRIAAAQQARAELLIA